jgi:hypothetical protein
VHRKFVTDDDVLDDTVDIKCAHGDTVSYPLAVVKITIGGKDIITTAAVSSTLPTSVLLGWDVPELVTLLTGVRPPAELQPEEAFATTRSQHRNSPPPEEAPAREEQNNEEPEEPDHPLSHLDASLFQPTGTPRPRLTRAQKWENRLRFRLGQQGLDISADELRALQDADRMPAQWPMEDQPPGQEKNSFVARGCSTDGTPHQGRMRMPGSSNWSYRLNAVPLF